MTVIGYRDSGYLRDTDPMVVHQSLVERSRSGERSARTLDNRVNWRWFNGEPYWFRQPTTNDIVGLDAARRKTFLYVNLMRDVVRALTGVMSFEPDIDAYPVTSDPGDIIRAEADQHIGRALIENGDLASELASVVEMENLYGDAYLKVFFDPGAGSRRPLYRAQICPVCSNTGQQVLRSGAPFVGRGPGSGTIMTMQGPQPCPHCQSQGIVPGQDPAPNGYVNSYIGVLPEGDVRFRAVHPDDMFIDPDATRWSEVEEIIHRMRMSPQQAYRMYGRKYNIPEKKFMDTPSSAYTDYMTDSMVTVAAMNRPGNSRYVSISEYMSRPTDKHPEGLLAVFMGSEEIYSGPPAIMHSENPFPFFRYEMYKSEGRYFCASTADIVLPLVLAYNDHLTAMHHRGKESARTRFLVPSSVGFTRNNETGNAHFNDSPASRYKPEPLKIPEYPEDAREAREILGEMIDRMSGATAAVRGTADAESGRAMAFLEERSLSMLRPIISRNARVTDSAIRYAIELCKNTYDEGRLIRTFGDSGAVQSMMFSTENSGDGADVRLKTVKNVGRSRATLMAELNSAAEQQMIEPSEYRELAEFGTLDQLYKKIKPHRDAASKENDTLDQTGNMPMALKHEMHDIHNQEHQKLLVKIKNRDPGDPAIMLLEQHMDMHEYFRAQLAVEFEMNQQVAASQFGMMNAANPQGQPQQNQANAQAGSPAGSSNAGSLDVGSQSEPYLATNSPLGAQPSLPQADAQATAVAGSR